MIGAAAYRGYRIRRLRELTGTLAIIVGVFAAIQVGLGAVNWAVYGKFVSVDFKEANYQRALRAIDSVRSGGTKPFVSITHASMKRVDTVSPAFASLAPYFDGPGKNWEAIGCRSFPDLCGEIGSGWFVWALRDAAAATGHYSSPTEASAFFGKIADEITAACARGVLECSPQLIAEMPPVNWADAIDRMPALYGRAFDGLMSIHPPLQFNPSSGSRAQIDAALHFLHYPSYTSSSAGLDTTYSLSGWYYKSGRKWLWAAVKAQDGSSVEVGVARNASQDLQTGFKDPEASHQRFVITTRCNDACTLELQSQDGETIQKKLAEFRHGSIGFYLGSGSVYVDDTAVANMVGATRSIGAASARVQASRFEWVCLHARAHPLHWCHQFPSRVAVVLETRLVERQLHHGALFMDAHCSARVAHCPDYGDVIPRDDAELPMAGPAAARHWRIVFVGCLASAFGTGPGIGIKNGTNCFPNI